MNVRRLTLLGCLALIAALFMPWRTESPLPGATAVAAPSRMDERVRIEHELVRIPVTAPKAPVKSARLTRPLPSTESPRARAENVPLRASNSTQPDRGMVAKAVKRLVGDGRYRPEPFPRVK